MSDLLIEKYQASCQPISRHQLYIHADIPYTSHNSSMCFEADIAIEECMLQNVIDCLAQYLEENAAIGSDPGLCVVYTAKLNKRHEFMAFGYQAKKTILTKNDAYKLAEQCHIHLTEHGGDGLGVIGALAGAALRFGGNDGRYKGHINVGINQDNMLVADLLQHPEIDRVCSLDGYYLKPEEEVFITERIKTVRRNGEAILLVEQYQTESHSVWCSCSKETLKKLDA